MSNQELCRNLPRAWVVFTGQTDLPWLRLLKKGFRHCYVLLHDGAHWVTIDPLSNYTDVRVHVVPADFDLPGWLRGRGHTVIAAAIAPKKRPAPWMVFTCVEAVKRLLGLQDRLIFTPYQLYRRLTASVRCTVRDDGKSKKQPQMKGELQWEV